MRDCQVGAHRQRSLDLDQSAIEFSARVAPLDRLALLLGGELRTGTRSFPMTRLGHHI
jgi:hypothetical protein